MAVFPRIKSLGPRLGDEVKAHDRAPHPRTGKTRVVVDGFLAGRLQRVVHAQPRRLWRIDPPGEGRKPFSDRQRIVIDNGH